MLQVSLELINACCVGRGRMAGMRGREEERDGCRSVVVLVVVVRMMMMMLMLTMFNCLCSPSPARW